MEIECLDDHIVTIIWEWKWKWQTNVWQDEWNTKRSSTVV